MARYAHAIAWIADNDGPAESTAMDIGILAESVTVMLVADIWRKMPVHVADDVVRYRQSQPKHWTLFKPGPFPTIR